LSLSSDCGGVFWMLCLEPHALQSSMTSKPNKYHSFLPTSV
jgi:hypothetical protein